MYSVKSHVNTFISQAEAFIRQLLRVSRAQILAGFLCELHLAEDSQFILIHFQMHAEACVTFVSIQENSSTASHGMSKTFVFTVL